MRLIQRELITRKAKAVSHSLFFAVAIYKKYIYIYVTIHIIIQLSQLNLKMACAQVVETSVANNSPSQDSSHPDDHFQSKYNMLLLGSNHFLINVITVTIIFLIIIMPLFFVLGR